VAEGAERCFSGGLFPGKEMPTCKPYALDDAARVKPTLADDRVVIEAVARRDQVKWLKGLTAKV